MSIEFTCQVCGRELKADERAIGRKVRCPDCATLLVIPDPAAVEDEGSEAGESIQDDPSLGAAERASDRPQQSPPKSPERPSEKPDIGATADMEPLEELIPLPPAPPLRPDRGSKRGGSGRAKPKQEVKAPPKPPLAVTAELSASSPSPPPRKTPHDDAPLLPPPRPHPEDLIDMTAMVDIVFFLLIFFLVTSLQALEAVMNLPTPQSGEPGISTGKSVAELENDPNYITVRIEDDDSIWVENTQVFNDQELALRLRTARQESDAAKSCLVIGDADASHGTAVRVFDAAAGANLSGISLVVQEKVEGSR